MKIIKFIILCVLFLFVLTACGTPYKVDNFRKQLCSFTADEVKYELDSLCSKNGRGYEFAENYEYLNLYVYSDSKEYTIELFTSIC